MARLSNASRYKEKLFFKNLQNSIFYILMVIFHLSKHSLHFENETLSTASIMLCYCNNLLIHDVNPSQLSVASYRSSVVARSIIGCAARHSITHRATKQLVIVLWRTSTRRANYHSCFASTILMGWHRQLILYHPQLQ